VEQQAHNFHQQLEFRRRSGMTFSKDSIQKAIVVMPTLRRPEMLALSLEKLAIARQRSQLFQPSEFVLNIFADTSDDNRFREIEYVQKTYCPEAVVTRAHARPSVPSGMWNILHSLKKGYESDADLVFLVEEDVLVSSDFFDWHMQTQASGDYLATCGRKLPRLPSYDKYQNPGACFKHEKLGLIVPHINDELFRDRITYYQKHFVNAPELSQLDDGLIRRIAKTGGYKVAYPESPKCAHIGFLAYNRYDGWLNLGDIQTRIAGLRKLLPRVSPEARYTKDFEPPID
jgi:hypothetical protein